MAVARWLRSKVVVAATLTLATVVFLYHGVERRTETVVTVRFCFPDFQSV